MQKEPPKIHIQKVNLWLLHTQDRNSASSDDGDIHTQPILDPRGIIAGTGRPFRIAQTAPSE